MGNYLTQYIDRRLYPLAHEPCKTQFSAIGGHPCAVVDLGFPTQQAIVFVHGNESTLQDVQKEPQLVRLAQRTRARVVGVSYPNYPGTGLPCDAIGAQLDAAACRRLRDVVQALQMSHASVKLMGHSLGCGAVLQTLATFPRIDVDGVVLAAPFTRLGDMFPIGLGWLAGDRWNNVRHLGTVRAPVQVFHGAQDEVIPLAHSRALHGDDVRVVEKGSHALSTLMPAITDALCGVHDARTLV